MVQGFILSLWCCFWKLRSSKVCLLWAVEGLKCLSTVDFSVYLVYIHIWGPEGFAHRNPVVSLPGEACHLLCPLFTIQDASCFPFTVCFSCLFICFFGVFIKEMAHFLHLHAAKLSLLQNPDAPKKVCVTHCFFFGFCYRITDCIEFLLLVFRTFRCLYNC